MSIEARTWTNIRRQDFLRLLEAAVSNEGLDVSSREIAEGHHRTTGLEVLIQCAYALGSADGEAAMGLRRQDSYDEVWRELDNWGQS